MSDIIPVASIIGVLSEAKLPNTALVAAVPPPILPFDDAVADEPSLLHLNALNSVLTMESASSVVVHALYITWTSTTYISPDTFDIAYILPPPVLSACLLWQVHIEAKGALKGELLSILPAG